MTAQGEGGSRTSVNRNKRCFRKLDVQHSTEQHFKIAENEKPQFYGAHGMLRKQLDYSYHCHYHKERQFVHDSIVEDYLETAEEKETEENSDHSTNWLIFTIGVQGAGKQHAFRELVESDVIPIRSYVRVDQDEICRCLPEYEWYLEQAPEVVEAMTKKESGYIAETLVLAALRAGKIVVWDCQIVDVDWYISRIKELRSLHPCLKIALMYITATKEEVNERCKAETELTGRTISPSCIGNCLSCLPNRVEKLKAEIDFDFSCQIQNDDNLLSIVGDQNFEVFSRDTVPTANERKSCRLSLIETEPFMEDAPEPVANRTSFRVSQDSTDLGDHPSMTKRSHRRRFSRFISSEENHKSDDMNFYGRFAHIRRTLDYNYHSNYTSERQRFQDAIILEFLKAAVIHDKDGEVCTTPTEPWLCFTAGVSIHYGCGLRCFFVGCSVSHAKTSIFTLQPMGSGKSHTMRRLVESGRFPLLAFVIVDPDEIRRQLPEYHLYVSTQPEIAGEMTRKEAGFIAEILTLAGLETGKVGPDCTTNLVGM